MSQETPGPISIEPAACTSTSGVAEIWLFVGGALVFIMQAGFALLEAGSVRAKNTKNILLKNVMDVCLGALVWWGIGYGFAFGSSSGSNHFIGAGDFFITDADVQDCSVSYGFFLFQWAFATTSATIVSGAVAERCQFRAYVAYTTLLTAFVYPVVVHWVWSSEGWLSAFNTVPFGSSDKLVIAGNGVIDHAGSGVVHMTGGGAALMAAIIIGPRCGRFGADRRPRPIHGHSSVLSALGSFILWFGWYAFNGLSPTPGPVVDEGAVPAAVAVKTTLAASTGCITATVAHLVRFNHLDVQPALNGILSGLVAITAGCTVVDSYAAVIIGGIAGLLWCLCSHLLLRNLVDDPLDASAVHLGGGLWGMISVGLFATRGGVRRAGYPNADEAFGLFLGGGWVQLGMQVLAAAAIGLWTCLLNGLLFLLLSRFNLLRVPVDAEVRGLDVWGHGGAAYVLESVHKLQQHSQSTGELAAGVPSSTDGSTRANFVRPSGSEQGNPEPGLWDEAMDTLPPLPMEPGALLNGMPFAMFPFGALSESPSSIWDRRDVLGRTSRAGFHANGAAARGPLYGNGNGGTVHSAGSVHNGGSVHSSGSVHSVGGSLHRVGSRSHSWNGRPPPPTLQRSPSLNSCRQMTPAPAGGGGGGGGGGGSGSGVMRRAASELLDLKIHRVPSRESSTHHPASRDSSTHDPLPQPLSTSAAPVDRAAALSGAVPPAAHAAELELRTAPRPEPRPEPRQDSSSRLALPVLRAKSNDPLRQDGASSAPKGWPTSTGEVPR